MDPHVAENDSNTLTFWFLFPIDFPQHDRESTVRSKGWDEFRTIQRTMQLSDALAAQQIPVIPYAPPAHRGKRKSFHDTQKSATIQ